MENYTVKLHERFGFVISGIIKVLLRVIRLRIRLRLRNLTKTLIILDITKTSSNNMVYYLTSRTSASMSCL